MSDQAANPIDANDMRNLVAVARQALPSLSAADLVHVAHSIQRIEAAIAALGSKPHATDGTTKAP